MNTSKPEATGPESSDPGFSVAGEPEVTSPEVASEPVAGAGAEAHRLHTGPIIGRDVLQAHLKATREDLERQVNARREQLEQVNERIEARVGRNLLSAIGIGIGLGGLLLVSLLVFKDLFAVLAVGFLGFSTVEIIVALRRTERRVDLAPNVVSTVGIVVAAYFNNPVLLWSTILAGIAFVAVWRIIAQMAAADGRTPAETLRDVTAAVLVQVYVAVLGSFSVVLTRQDHGEWWTLAFLIIVVSVDVGAYAAGLSFGKHPMAPKISPKKTWEGFAGAVIAALIASILLAIFMLGVPFWVGIVLAIVFVASATMGDLAESLIKRDIGIKDMSSWLPGHGGFLDRIDSMLPSAPLACAVYFIFSPLSTLTLG